MVSKSKVFPGRPWNIKDNCRSMIVPMPQSLDLSSYLQKTSMDEEKFLSSPSSSDDSNAEERTLLGKTESQSSTSRDPRWVRSPWFFLMDCFLIALVAISYSYAPKDLHLSLLGDVTGFVPKFTTQIVTFKSHPEFISNHTSLESLREAREHWISLLPRT